MSSGPPPPLSLSSGSGSSTTYPRLPAKFARKASFTIKREEVQLKRESDQDQRPGSAVSDADAQLLLNLHLNSATPAPPSITSPASRVSIASLVNAVNTPVSMTYMTPPHSAPPRTTTFSEPPVHQLRARSASPRAPTLPPLALARSRDIYTPEIMSGVESRATRSMSISLEPDPAPFVELVSPIRPIVARPASYHGKSSAKATASSSSPAKSSSSSSPGKPSSSKSSPSKTLLPLDLLPVDKLRKPRGRVSKGPKKRSGPGWIIESCTTSGAASDDDGINARAPSSSPEPSVVAAKLEDISRDVFGGDSDMSELSSSDSDDPEPEVEEYDPGLAGLPALPVSSESEYEPALRPESAGGEKRSRRRGVNYQVGSPTKSELELVEADTVESETEQLKGRRASVSRGRGGGRGRRGSTRRAGSVESRSGSRARTASREPSAEHEHEGSLSRPTRRGASVGGSRARGRGAGGRGSRKNVNPTATPSTSAVTPGSTRGRRGGRARTVVEAPVSTTSSVSLGTWVDDPRAIIPRMTRRAAGTGTSAGTSSLTELSSPSLGGGVFLDSPVLGGGRLLDSPAFGVRQLGSPMLANVRQLDSPAYAVRLLGSPVLAGVRQLESPSLGGTRSDAGTTHVSESVETHVSETTGGGDGGDGVGVDERDGVEGVDERDGVGRVDGRDGRPGVDEAAGGPVGTSSRRKIVVKDFGQRTVSPKRPEPSKRTESPRRPELPKHTQPPRREESPRRLEPPRRAESPRRTGELPELPSDSTLMKIVLPPRSKSKHHSSPTRTIATPARLVPASFGRGTSRSPQQVFVLLPSSSARRGHRRRDASPSDDHSVDEEPVVKGRRKSYGERDRESPSKRSRLDLEASSSRDKGKGKAVTGEADKDSEMASVSGRRSRRQSKPTARAIESAEQELGWDDDDGFEGGQVWVTIQESRSTGSSAPSEGSSSRSMSLGRSASASRGASTSRISKSSGKRRRDEHEHGSSGSKRHRTSLNVESAASGPPLVHLQEGDYILRAQDKRCFYYPWDQAIVSRCLACRKKKAGDTCRFTGIRYFKLKPVSFDAIGVSFDSVPLQKVKEQSDYHLPLNWNITPEIAHVDRIRSVIAPALHTVLEDELKHALKENAIWRPVETEVRATCDVCATSMFTRCNMCTQCGRELCGECFRQVELMCPAGTPTIYRSSERKDPQLHKYRACAAGNVFHVPHNFRPVTRFTRKELEETLKDMKTILDNNAPARSPSRSGTSHIAKWASRVPVWNPTSPQASTEPPALSEAGSSHDVSSPRGTPDPQLASMPIIASPTMSPTHEDGFASEVGVEAGKRPAASQPGRIDPTGIPSHSVHYFSRDITEDQFKPIWARGEAVVVHGLLSDFKIKWTPEYFIEEYGTQECVIENCVTDKQQRSIVQRFFEQFGQTDRGNAILKLKDWPAKADFRDEFPELFGDFMNALPIPNYTRRDGILNVASHFATNAIAPDLGPKMYNAFASSEAPGGQGSTRLHMDMADAVNIMMFASDSKDGLPGVAAWDIFRASDSDKIRAYLRRHFSQKATQYRDPIHSQLFFLDSDHRRRLYEEEKVYSWRIYQRPGDAVFIPAGCAHQVCNLADCIKVAIDFVSLENIDRCEKLTAEFRNENDTFTWKEDVLQLRTMMMYAWRSAAQLRRAWEEDYSIAK
ncbi:hypothetical protein FRC12_006293 [Ceratobasidium sp. 428]|nr:hypothetical protein FRC12_006293 [Ceratobasidium sp. 428]